MTSCHTCDSIPHSRKCEKTGMSEGLWDCLGRWMDVVPSNKCIFWYFLGVMQLFLNSFNLKKYFLYN